MPEHTVGKGTTPEGQQYPQVYVDDFDTEFEALVKTLEFLVLVLANCWSVTLLRPCTLTGLVRRVHLTMRHKPKGGNDHDRIRWPY